MKKKQMIALGLAVVMIAGCLSGCGGSSGSSSSGTTGETSASSGTSSGTSTDAASDTSADASADASGYTYTGEAPITQDAGATLKILAQTSNYTNVDIASAEIVETVIAHCGALAAG